MALRSSLDLELRPLLKALRNRIKGLRGTVMEPKDRLEVFSRDGVPFMQLEIRRDHMNVDLWLPEDKLIEARSTNLARPHPFDPEHAVVVRFERATDLTTVARWLEDAHRFALDRKNAPPAPAEASKVERKPSVRKAAKVDGPKKKAATTRAAKPAVSRTQKAAAKSPAKKSAASPAKRSPAKRTLSAQ